MEEGEGSQALKLPRLIVKLPGMKPKALQPEAAADPPAAIREESKDKEAAAAAAPPQAEGNTEEPSKAVDASAKAEETNVSPPQALDQAAKVGGVEDKERVPAGAETGAPAGSEGNQGQTGQAAAKVEETEQAEPAPASEMVSDGKQETANLTAQAVSGADDKAGAGQAPDGGAKAGHGVEAEQVPASANAPPAPAVEEGAADPTAGGQQIPAASAAPPDQPGEGAMDVDVKTEGAQDLPSDQKTAADSEPKDDKNQVLASGDLQNPQILSQTPQAAGGGASLAGVPLTSGELNQPNQNASFYQVMQMHAAQAQGQAEAQAQAIQATRAHQVGVGSPISQGKAAPGSSPMRGVPYMNMPPQLQGMPMQVPKGFLVPQQMMVQAAQAQAQAQAQFQAQAQQVQAQAQAQFQAQQAQAQFQQARAQAVAQGQAKPKVGDKKDGSKKRKIEQQGKGPAKKPAAAKKKKPAKEKLTQKDAIEYLTKVKERFKDKLTVYNKFLDIMRKFGMKKINTAGVVELVKTLFKGHKDLLRGFNTFVPSGYEIRIAEPGSKAGKGREPKGASASAEDPKLSEHHASEYGRKFAMKTALLAGLVYVLQRWQDACPTLILDCLYCLGLYSLLGVIEDGIGALFSASVLGIPVERSFDRFYFSANLAEFWSLRWNQHGEFDSAPPSSLDSSLTNRPPGAPPLSLSLSPSVAKLLKVVVYEPIVRGELVHKAKPKPPRSSLTKHTIKKALALLLTFVASGVMHEVVFAYGSGAGFTPNFGWFKFFSLQGVYVLAEQVVGRAVKSRPPKWVSIVGTLSFLLVTGDRHFFRAVREAGVDRAVVSNLHSLLS